MTSPNSDSAEQQGSVFAADHTVNSFSRHDVVKLDERSFV